MIVAFDTWALSSRFRDHGTYVYAKRLLLEFQRLAGNERNISIRAFASPGLPNDANRFHGSPGFELVDTGGLRFDRLWRLGGATFAAARAKANLIFAPSPLFPSGAVPAVTTIHDATPIKYPTLPESRNGFARLLLWGAAKFSKKVITDSEWSKKDLVDVYGIPPEKVAVVYLGYDRDTFNVQSADPEAQKVLLARLGITAPYVFHHGVVQPRKNLQRLIQAYRVVMERHSSSDLQLVIAGPLGWRYEEIVRVANESGHRGSVLLTGRLSDQEMAALLKGGKLCVVPSLYEGFCLPLVEAMACGVPTIASSASCLPEISGGVLRYFDPHSVEEMASRIWEVLDDQSLQQDLVGKGLDRASEFGWERCAEETLGVLSAVHDGLSGTHCCGKYSFLNT